MHITQTKILEAAKTHDVLTLGLRPLGKLIGEKSPQVVKHHLMQLQKKGLLMPHTREAMLQSLKHSAMQQSSFTKIPILGNANCDEATIRASHFSIHYTRATSAPEGLSFKVGIAGANFPVSMRWVFGKTHIYAALAALSVASLQNCSDK
jgi:hypothetical protein